MVLAGSDCLYFRLFRFFFSRSACFSKVGPPENLKSWGTLYIYIYVYIYILVGKEFRWTNFTKMPDPINHVCSNKISDIYFTYCRVQIYKMIFLKFYSPESDPPHKIMRYWVYNSTKLFSGFPTDRICNVQIICIGGVPVWKRHLGP